MMDVRLSNGREANCRSKPIGAIRAVGIKLQVVDLFGEDACPTVVTEGDDVVRVYYYREPVGETKRKDAAAGQTWQVRVGLRVASVKLKWVGRLAAGHADTAARLWFCGTNLRTGREIEGHRARLRRRIA